VIYNVVLEGWGGGSKVLRKGNENREVLRVAQGRYSNSGGGGGAK